MLIGVVGKPNSGKSTFFSAATLVDVPIANYPFTTIEPNKGVTYVRLDCPCKELNITCNPNNSKCEERVRLLPMALLDVAGLVPEAHLGKGLGNKFLDDLRTADALIQVVDASGKTDLEGRQCESCDPAGEVVFLENEIAQWLAGIIKRSWQKIKGGNLEALSGLLSGLKITEADIAVAAAKSFLPTESINWSEDDILAFARSVREISKPIVIAANKIDVPGARENYEQMKQKFPEKLIVPCCAEAELALRRAAKKGVVKYTPGDEDFEILAPESDKQKSALEFLKGIARANSGTGVQQIINAVVFDVLALIVVYPVEDEHHFANHFGKVLPDAFLVKKGTTALGLAEKIHTDLAKNFIGAIDARTRLRVGKEHVLKNNDIIKIVAGAR
ncbi:MAG: redox-regulated ATPase YchF [Candidatus Micrarchaeota archaeon]